MEIEAKFIVPDAEIARQLGGLDLLGEFKLRPPTRFKTRDTFFDTRDGALRQARAVLRVRRRSDGKTFVTLKTPSERKGAIHRRPEIEREIQMARTPHLLRVASLPRAIKDGLDKYVKDESLYPLFSITQSRGVRVVKHGTRRIAEWSLDRVMFRVARGGRAFYELEIELKHGGTERELRKLEAWITKEFELEAQGESKFARALEFYSDQSGM